MLRLDHVFIAVRDLDRGRPFYEAIMDALDAAKVCDREMPWASESTAVPAGRTFIPALRCPLWRRNSPRCACR